MIYHGTVKHGLIELQEGVRLPEGTTVKVEPLVDDTNHRPRSRLGSLQGSVLHMAADFDAPLEDFKGYMQ